MFKKIKNTCEGLEKLYEFISKDRKAILEKISAYIQSKKDQNEAIQLIYVCTHNSRRSHFGQIWAKVASDYYQIPNVKTYSGGTEATALNINAIQALREIGFEVESQDQTSNPVYTIRFGENGNETTCFSKVYDHEVNPSSNFAAIMTCSDAEENCPFIPGVELRIGTTYEDPKAFDGTPKEQEKYIERSLQIGLETMYVFSKVK